MPPAPKHPSQRVRRNKDVPMNQLPAEGRTGRTPTWPISKATPDEAKAWKAVWRTPQAVVWETQHLERIVARYVRLMVAAEDPDAPVTMQGQVAKLEEHLLLTPHHLKAARYEIVPREEATVTPLRALPQLSAADFAS